MRAREFIKPIFEAEEPRNIYTIGDSHADIGGIASYNGVINRANGGLSSTHRNNFGGSHTKTGAPVGLDNIPPKQIVIISQGANDTANSMRAHMDSKGKKPLVPPTTIASNVAKVVSAAQSNGHIVVFVLFPNGPGRGSGLAQYYGGDYQEEVRRAIKSAIGVPIIDLDGKGLSPDGIHATRGAYMSAAKEAIDIAKSKAGGAVSLDPSAKDKGKDKADKSIASTFVDRLKNKVGINDKESGEEFSVEVPQGTRGPAIADVQKSLEALGIPLPKYGVDGIQGKETTGAIKTFQERNGLPITGVADKETVSKLNSMLKAKPDVLAKLKKSTNADVKAIDYSRSREELQLLTSSESTKKARESAEKYLGRPMSDTEWDDLLRAVTAEASNNSKEQAYVMGVILNRARNGHGRASANVTSVLYAPNQFQAVTGTRYEPGNSANFRRGPTERQLANIVDGAINILPQVPTNLKYFTAASAAAYGPGTNIGFRDRMIAQGGEKIGGTIFAATA